MCDGFGMDVNLHGGARWIHKAIEHQHEGAVALVTEWGVKSEAGDVMSQLYLGVMHASEGRHEDAIALWEKARENGAIDADVFLGECYERGEGVAKNMETAVGHYIQAASNGSDLAQAKFKARGWEVSKQVNESEEDDEAASVGKSHLIEIDVEENRAQIAAMAKTFESNLEMKNIGTSE